MEPTRGYWVESPGRGALRATPLPEPGPDDVVLRALATGVSPGTERLVGLGRVPAACDTTMTVPGMAGSFALPVLYGYAFVGVVERGPHAGRRAFTMAPHQERVVVPAARCVWLPDDVPARRATLFANLETALNAAWDAAPAPGERLVVVGAGAVGSLVAFALAATAAAAVAMPCVLVDADAARRRRAAALPWARDVRAPDAVPRDTFACAVHASGGEAGLQLALDAVGFEGRVVDLSWYGDRPVTLRLGEAFHRGRKQLRASQVGTVAPSHRAAGRAARTAAVVELLRDARLDALVGVGDVDVVPFAELPAFFARLYRGDETAPCPVVGYE